MLSALPTIVVSMGDPGGIGPEVLARALAGDGGRRGVRFHVYGSGLAMRRAAEVCGVEPYWWTVKSGSGLLGSARAHAVVLIDTDEALPPPATGWAAGDCEVGGRASFRWVESAIEACRLKGDDPARGEAIVTGPISKMAWSMAGHKRWAGHTELLRDRFHAKRVAMMFEGPSLRVVLATVHIPLMEIRNALTIGKVFDAIDLGAEGCRGLGIERPKIAVCGLNPHAGEGGLMGDEETRLIEPAIEHAVRGGLDVSGPFPADTVFNHAVGGRFDLVVAMYHDQGLIPVKLLARDASVNVTLGLPTVRTSPDHGTAFDIAGRGTAEEGSMKSAIEVATRMLNTRSVAGMRVDSPARNRH